MMLERLVRLEFCDLLGRRVELETVCERPSLDRALFVVAHAQASLPILQHRRPKCP